MIRRVRLLVAGRVQGVWYRDGTRRRALALGLTGWVRNLSDGRVEVLAEGPEAALRSLADWCREGPPLARVESVEETWEEATGGFDTFEVTWS